jgi:hypothetical protein
LFAYQIAQLIVDHKFKHVCSQHATCYFLNEKFVGGKI